MIDKLQVKQKKGRRRLKHQYLKRGVAFRGQTEFAMGMYAWNIVACPLSLTLALCMYKGDIGVSGRPWQMETRPCHGDECQKCFPQKHVRMPSAGQVADGCGHGQRSGFAGLHVPRMIQGDA